MPDHRQPDQRPEAWNDHVLVYERAFEPLTDRFAAAAIAALDLAPGSRCLDVAAGAGGAALMLARRGVEVVAVDAAPGMAARIAARAGSEALPVSACVMDAARLAVADRAVDAALSVFGVILCPDAEGAVREMARTVRPGGRVALVTWTEPERYELVARLLAAAPAPRGGPAPAPPPAPPAQLRYREEVAFRALLSAGGLLVERIERLEAWLEAPSAAWLADHLAFAPGLAAMLAAQGDARAAMLARFVDDLVRDQGAGPVRLGAVASLGVARVPGDAGGLTHL